MGTNYQLGLLHLVHLLVSADGEVDERERQALLTIKQHEGITEETFTKFQTDISRKAERQIYNDGLDLLSNCNAEEKMRAFLVLYKLAEVDGRVHVKEVRFLLYSMRFAGVDFDEIQKKADGFQSFF